MQLKYIMDTDFLTTNQDISLEDAAKLFNLSSLNQIPIVSSCGKPQGMITVKGLLNAITTKGALNCNIKDIMEEVIQINENARISDVVEHPLEKIAIINNKGKFVGTISPCNVTRALLRIKDITNIEINAILDGSNSGIVAIDKDEKIIFYNKSAEKFLGYSAAEALGENIEELIPHTRLTEIVRTGEAEIGYRFVYGERTFITNRTPIKHEGKVFGALAIFQDITELQNIMEELTEVKKYQHILETVLDNAYDGILVVNAEGNITMYNKAYENFLKIPRDQVIGKHVTEVIENTRMHIVLKTGEPEIGHIQRIQGHDMVCMRLPIKKNEKIVGVVGKVMFKDVKELKALAEKLSNLQTELEYYKDVVKKMQGSHYTFANIIGSSPSMQDIKEKAIKVARSNSTVLIRGESGTGKELFAHAIHYASPRKEGPFIKINCSAIPESLLESELFGYEEGAFTGAKKGGKLGKFEMANNGTIFLDEIGDMPINMQVKLLRVLQEKEIERIGGNKNIPINVRIITATNRPLEDLIKEGKFRLDLYYRLNVVDLKIPSLKHRKEDIPVLVNFLLIKLSTILGCPKPEIDSHALELLLNYSWPGNIRELENVLERCINFVEQGVIRVNNIPYYIRRLEFEDLKQTVLLKDILEETERLAIIEAIRVCNGNKLKAAQMLGISRAGIYQKMEKYNIC